MGVLEVAVSAPRTVGERVRFAATLRSPTRAADELWYDLDAGAAEAATTSADPFVVVTTVFAMAEGCDLRVTGAPVSPSLLRNLDEFQQVWHAWYGLPVVDLAADDEREREHPAPDATVVAFSGGLDSSFSAHRHAVDPPRRARPVGAALMIHGMDVPHAELTGFAGAAGRARRMLAGTGLPLVTVRTNAWDLRPERRARFPAAGVASALHVVAGGFGAGLISSTSTYADLTWPLASTPLSDHLLGGRSFEIVHDGAAFDRLTKLRCLVEWGAPLAHLRVCLDDPSHDRNCGRCDKCVLTYLGFRVLGIEPSCFDRPPGVDAVARWARRLPSHPVYAAEMQAVVEQARAAGIDEPWVGAARRRLRFVAARRAGAVAAPALAAKVRRALAASRRRI